MVIDVSQSTYQSQNDIAKFYKAFITPKQLQRSVVNNILIQETTKHFQYIAEMPYIERIPLHESIDAVNWVIKYCRLKYIPGSDHL